MSVYATITKDIGDKLMREGEIFHIQELDKCTIKFVRYLNELYKIILIRGRISIIEYWGSTGWFIWKKV